MPPWIPGHEHIPTLQAARVCLRPARDADAPALFEFLNDPQVSYRLARPLWTDLDQAVRFAQRMRQAFDDRTAIQWIIADEHDVAIGNVLLFHIHLAHRRAEMGWCLARASWGCGFAFEACARVVRFAFDDLNLHRIEAFTEPSNHASVALAERLGFVQEGTLRQRWRMHDDVSDTLILGLLCGQERTEFQR